MEHRVGCHMMLLTKQMGMALDMEKLNSFVGQFVGTSGRRSMPVWSSSAKSWGCTKHSPKRLSLQTNWRAKPQSMSDTCGMAGEPAPPGTETKLFRDEFQAEMKGQKEMPVSKLVSQAIAGIGRGKTEIRSGFGNVLYLLSRLAPVLPSGQMAKMVPASR